MFHVEVVRNRNLVIYVGVILTAHVIHYPHAIGSRAINRDVYSVISRNDLLIPRVNLP